MSEKRSFLGGVGGWGLPESARAEEKNHRGTEGTEKGCDLCLCVLNVLTKTWFC